MNEEKRLNKAIRDFQRKKLDRKGLMAVLYSLSQEVRDKYMNRIQQAAPWSVLNPLDYGP